MKRSLGRVAELYAYANLKYVAALAVAPLLPDSVRLDWGLLPRPHYAWGMLRAATLAKQLGHDGVTVIEFGVAGGDGLLALDRCAQLVHDVTGVEVSVVGFDRETGMPPPRDHRDCPYRWSEGFYRMPGRSALERELRRSELLIGEVGSTVAAFRARPALADAPVGFVIFDLDYYSSTVDAFALFEGDGHLLPRVVCYLDDIPHLIPQVGELAAVKEFNDTHVDRQIGRLEMLRSYLPFHPSWGDKMFEFHDFAHEHYGKNPMEGDVPMPSSPHPMWVR